VPWFLRRVDPVLRLLIMDGGQADVGGGGKADKLIIHAVFADSVIKERFGKKCGTEQRFHMLKEGLQTRGSCPVLRGRESEIPTLLIMKS
jgi:hypothetical protein